MNPNNFNRIHFIGIGGIGMSALARFFVHEKKVVTGTNDNPSPYTLDALREQGVDISLDTTVLPEADIYIYSEAWHHINPEILAKAKDTGKPCVNYFEALGMVANPYYLIAIAGAHGKTTTTAMVTDVLEETGLDPTAIIGSLRSKTGSNFRPGKSKYAVVEACEYKRDFLHLKPEVLVITNIEYEHVDYYKNLEDVQDAFRTLAMTVPETGFVIADTTSPTVMPVLKDIKATVVDYRQFFDINLTLHKPGIHNRLNAAAALAVASVLEVEESEAKTALENFAGTWRRFEYKGTFLAGENGAIPVFDDYGHHPTEIMATLEGAREMYPGRHITLVFQSHTYSRTHELFADFVKALAKADSVFMLPIYAAREENTYGVTSEQLAEALHKEGETAEVFETYGGLVERVKETAPQGGVVVVMGAGDVTKVADLLTK